MKYVPQASMLLSLVLALTGCAETEPAAADADAVEAAVKQANETAARVERDEATEDALDGL